MGVKGGKTQNGGWQQGGVFKTTRVCTHTCLCFLQELHHSWSSARSRSLISHSSGVCKKWQGLPRHLPPSLVHLLPVKTVNGGARRREDCPGPPQGGGHRAGAAHPGPTQWKAQLFLPHSSRPTPESQDASVRPWNVMVPVPDGQYNTWEGAQPWGHAPLDPNPESGLSRCGGVGRAALPHRPSHRGSLSLLIWVGAGLHSASEYPIGPCCGLSPPSLVTCRTAVARKSPSRCPGGRALSCTCAMWRRGGV